MKVFFKDLILYIIFVGQSLAPGLLDAPVEATLVGALHVFLCIFHADFLHSALQK